MVEPYQPTSPRIWNSLVIEGMAVIIIVVSRDARKMLRTRAMTMAARRRPPGYSSSTILSRVSSVSLFSTIVSLYAMAKGTGKAVFGWAIRREK